MYVCIVCVYIYIEVYICYRFMHIPIYRNMLLSILLVQLIGPHDEILKQLPMKITLQTSCALHSYVSYELISVGIEAMYSLNTPHLSKSSIFYYSYPVVAPIFPRYDKRSNHPCWVYSCATPRGLRTQK